VTGTTDAPSSVALMHQEGGAPLLPPSSPMPSVHVRATLAALTRRAGKAEALIRASVAKSAANSQHAAEKRRKRVAAESAGGVDGATGTRKRPRTHGVQADVAPSEVPLTAAGPASERPSSGQSLAGPPKAQTDGAPAVYRVAPLMTVGADAGADRHGASDAGCAADRALADSPSGAIERFLFRFPAPHKKKGGSRSLEECVTELRSMVLQALCKATWPPQLSQDSSVESFVPLCQDARKEIDDNQPRCALILCESVLAKAVAAAT